MSSLVTKRVIAALLSIAIFAPTYFVFMVPRAQAISVTEVGANLWTNIKTTIESTISATQDIRQTIEQTLTRIASVTTALRTTALWINEWILMPLAFIMSGNLLKMVAASVVAFVAGALNKSGLPQFVQDLNGHFQAIGDLQTRSFLISFQRNSNSPFAGAITSSIRTNYLAQTSLEGFFAANKSTLPQFSINPGAYVSGNWSAGGLNAWFALTTQEQNNPYFVKTAAEGKLKDLIDSAVSAREQMLAWGQGFLSWCDTDGGGGTPTEAGENADITTNLAPAQCYDSDGNAGKIQTPGSVIKNFLDEALWAPIDKLKWVGQLGPQINGILGDLSVVMGTISFAQNLFEGGNSGGLSGVIQSGPGGTSVLTQYRNNPSYLGVTASEVYKTAGTQPLTTDPLALVSQYESAWNVVKASATGAKTAATRLAQVCENANAAAAATQTPEGFSFDSGTFLAVSAQEAAAAKAALSGTIEPTLARAEQALANSAVKRQKIAKVQADFSAGADANGASTLQQLANMDTVPPTSNDLAEIAPEAIAHNAAQASPGGSLNVYGGSLIDQFSLLAANAQSRLTQCSPETYIKPLPPTSSGGD